jgi:predicted DNA-binding ribbon-helix-helix protein
MKLKHRADLPTTSSNEKRSVKIDGQPTSVSLEDAFWHALKEIAAKQNIAVQDLVLKIDKGRTHGNLSSAVRVYVLCYYYDRHDHKT